MSDTDPELTPHATSQPRSWGETQLTPDARAWRLRRFRHRAEAAAARISADCERLLRAAHQRDRAAWRSGVEAALLASRQVIAITQQAAQPSGDHAAAAMESLERELAPPLQRIAEAMASLLRVVPTSVDDEMMLEDARGIRDAAVAALSLSSRAPSGGDQRAARTADSGTVADAVAGARNPASAELPIPARILVVDDDAAVRRALERLLRQIGHDVVLATDGREGLETAGARDVDLVITDLSMPNMDGMELLRALKASPELRHLPVIVVSSEDTIERVSESIESGADDHIAKPFDPTLLRSRVRSSLARKRMRDVELDFLRRVSRITAAAEAVDGGEYEPGSLTSIARGHDELARLARVFERMVGNMRSRAERLNHRLHRLSREVSEVWTLGAIAAPATPDSPLAAGQLFGNRYDVIGRIGQGGMGVVYCATDRDLGEEVAIKIVRSDLIDADPTLLDRLKSEIRLARKLTHPNILRAHDLGEWEGTHYITMEFVRGVSLAELLDQRGRLPADAAIAVGVQLADALAVAHAQQILHRDIKPGNIMMGEDGTLKVTDFGLAKVMTSERGHTSHGAVVGTPQYMAPEQLMGGRLDARSDLFAAGIVLYECLSGRAPFDAESPTALAAQMIDGTYAPLAELVPDVPPGLDAVVRSLLEFQPAARIASAAELSARLSELEPAPVAALPEAR